MAVVNTQVLATEALRKDIERLERKVDKVLAAVTKAKAK